MAADSLCSAVEEQYLLDSEEHKSEIVRVDLSSQELVSFCIKTDNGIKWDLVADLDLAFNNLTGLPAELASNIPNIQTLDLSGNIFKSLPEVVGELSGIVSLKANESCIKDLPPNSLRCLNKLKQLSLVGNSLSEIDEQFIFPENLENLYLDESELTYFPSSICNLRNLTVLEAADNALTTLPAEFGDICNLEVVNLSQNKLVSLPESFGFLERLKVVDLSNNLLKGLPDSFWSVDTLLTLYANHNRLETLPPWTSNLTKIETFAVKDNTLLVKPLDEEFCENVKDTLRVFLLGGNFIEFLPTNLGLLSKVEFFHIGSIIGELERSNFQNGNWIRDLPDNFGQMVALRKLRLDENQFERLPDNFGDLVNLEFLDLGQNRLRHLPESFCKLRSLKKCLLSKNCLQELPEEFGNLATITELFLNANELKVLPASMVKLTNLEILDLYDNKLSTVPEFLPSLIRLNALDLDGNCFDIDELEVPRMFKANYYSTDRKKFGVGSAQGINGTSMTPLMMALEKKRSLWASHGETKDRQRVQGRKGNADENGVSSLSSLDEPDPDESGLNVDVEAEEDWDLELDAESPYDNGSVYRHPSNKSSPRGEPAVDFFFLPSVEHAPETTPTVFHTDIEEGQFDDAD